MDVGREQEIVYESIPEPAPSQQRLGATIKGPGAEPTRNIASADNESIDMSTINMQGALGFFLTREAEVARSDVGQLDTSGTRRGLQFDLGSSRGSLEQLGQRCTRVHVELTELLCVVDDAADMCSGGNEPALCSRIAEELRGLRQQLRAMTRGRCGNGPKSSRASAVPTASALLERLASGPDSEKPLRIIPDYKGVTWDISYMPSISGIAQTSQIAALTGRLAEIEKELGTCDPAAQIGGMQSAMTVLYRRLSLLDVQRLEAVRRGMSKAARALDAALSIQEGSRGVAEPEVVKRVADAYECCHRWAPIAATLPVLVSRLQSLQALHEQGVEFRARLSALEHQQSEVAKLLEVTSNAVHDLGQGMQENMLIVQANMQNLEHKLLYRVRPR